MTRSRLLGAGLALGATGAIAAAACALSADRWHVFDLVAQFAAPAMTVACVGATASAAALRPRLAGLWLLAVAGLLIAMRPQLRPATPAPLPGVPPVTVFFNNAWVRNSEPARLATSIRAADPDVIVLVEVGPRHLRAVQPMLTGYPHRVASVTGRFRGGAPRILIASKRPLRVRASERRDGLAVTEVDVASQFGPFRLVASHLTRPWPFDDPAAQTRQASRLGRRILAGDPSRTVVVGDFNAVAAGAVLRRFSSATGLVPLAARTGTWPSGLPSGLTIGIDNALAGRGLSLSGRRLGAPTGSDHRAVVFEVRPAQPSAAALRRLRLPDAGAGSAATCASAGATASTLSGA